MHNVISSSSLCAEGEIFLSERMTFFNAFILFSLTAVPENALGRRIFRARLTVPFPEGSFTFIMPLPRGLCYANVAEIDNSKVLHFGSSAVGDGR